jgi:predicted NodU family carbamoyl transferase
MGVSIDELGDRASKAESRVDIAGRCAVFAESDVIHKQQQGAREEHLMAGMCHALVNSYMSNVAKGKTIEGPICFQGGVAANAGMKKAFEEVLGEKLLVPDEHKVMGALGASLLAMDLYRDRQGSDRGAREGSNFRGFGVGEASLELRESRCSGCSNGCNLISVETGDGKWGYFGDMCGRYSC